MVMDFTAGTEFFVADALLEPPEGEPIGPMAFEVRLAPDAGRRDHAPVRQSADDDGAVAALFRSRGPAGSARSEALQSASKGMPV